MSVEPLRHLSVFKPHAFSPTQVDVIGCGATGSRIVLSLAKLGVEKIRVFDFDTIEDHNIANQAFGLSDVGKLKVNAMSAIVARDTHMLISACAERVESNHLLGEVVYLLTDTMASRKQIWDACLKYKMRTKLLIETRMGADSGRVYALNPNKPSHIRAWEETLYGDEETEVSACGASVSVGPTAEIISGLAVWQMIRWAAIEQGADDVLDNEIIFSLRSMTTLARQF